MRLTDEILAALTGQTTVVSGTRVAEHIIGRLATQLQQLTQQRLDIDTEILSVVDAHPFTDFLTSMPGVGIRAVARILTEVVAKTLNPQQTWPRLLASHPSLANRGLRPAAKRPADVATKS